VIKKEAPKATDETGWLQSCQTYFFSSKLHLMVSRGNSMMNLLSSGLLASQGVVVVLQRVT